MHFLFAKVCQVLHNLCILLPEGKLQVEEGYFIRIFMVVLKRLAIFFFYHLSLFTFHTTRISRCCYNEFFYLLSLKPLKQYLKPLSIAGIVDVHLNRWNICTVLYQKMWLLDAGQFQYFGIKLKCIEYLVLFVQFYMQHFGPRIDINKCLKIKKSLIGFR